MDIYFIYTLYNSKLHVYMTQKTQRCSQKPSDLMTYLYIEKYVQ